MKLAVISDIHGNVPALEAVLEDLQGWDPDQVIINGDAVNRGPCSQACMELLSEHLPNARAVKGNHENLVINSAGEEFEPDNPAAELRRMSHWTAAQMSDTVARIRAWYDNLDIADAELGNVHVTHGSRRGDRDGITPDTTDEELPEKIGDEPCDLFICSHTHRPVVRHCNGTLVVNTGAVGQPFDRDPRAAYGRFVRDNGEWHVEIARVPFDRDRALRDFYDSGFIDEAGPLARVIYREVTECRPLLGSWMARYSGAVKAGEITASEAVDQYLAAV